MPLRTFHQSHSAEQRGRFDGGVYDSKGRFCEASRQIKIRHDHTPDANPLLDNYSKIDGGLVYGGLLQNTHFGHFVAESLTRLWAALHLSEAYNRLIFIKRISHKAIPGYAEQLISLLWPGAVILAPDEVVKVDSIAIPDPICGPANGFLVGHPLVHRSIKHLQWPTTGLRIYVSRSKLTPASGGYLAEKLLEENLARDGYLIFHPQDFSIQEQLKTYSSASDLIFADGSALHLYSLVSKKEQTVFVIWRRAVISGFQWQLNTFNGPTLRGEPAVKQLWLSSIDPRKTARARAELDFAELRRQLHDAGMISSQNWQQPTDEYIAEELRFINSKLPYELAVFS